eukprot:10346773-Karenia_brevis.AAC.1
MSGTYRIPEQFAHQSRLPPMDLWHFIDVDGVARYPANAQLHMLPQGHALVPPWLWIGSASS